MAKSIEAPVRGSVPDVSNPLIYLLLAAAAVAVGGVHTEVAIGLGLVAWVAVWFMFQQHGDRRVLVSIPSTAFVLFAGVAAVQLVPLPEVVHEFVSPSGWSYFEEGWRAVFGATREMPSFRPLSLDPEQTADRGLRWLTVAAVAVVALNRVSKDGGVRTYCWAVAGTGLLVLAIGAVQVWSGTEKVLFWYEPAGEITPFSTFVSGNHAASFFGLAGLAGAGLAFRKKAVGIRGATMGGLAASVLIVASMHQQSLGATSALAVGFGVLVFAVYRTERVPSVLANRWVRGAVKATMLVVVIGGIAAIAMMIVGPLVWGESTFDAIAFAWFAERVQTRAELVRAAMRGSTDYWAFGAGAGTLERVLPAYLDWSRVRPAATSTVENEFVQWFFEYGLVVGAVGILLVVSYVWFGARRFERAVRARHALGTSVAVYTILLAQMHFPFLALGVALPMVALVEASIFAQRDRSGSASGWVNWRRGVVRLPRRVAGGILAACSVAFVLFGVAAVYHRVDLTDRGAEGAESGGATLEELVYRIPSDGNVYIRAAGRQHEQGRSERARELADFAYRIEPSPSIAVLRANMHVLTGDRREAVEAYRALFSERFTKIPATWVEDFVVPALRSPEAVAKSLERAAPRHWQAAARVFSGRSHAQAAEFGLALQELRADHPKPYRIAVESYLQMGQAYLAELHARTLLGRDLEGANGEKPAGYGLLLRSLREQKKFEAARATAAEAMRVVPESPEAAKLALRVLPNDPADASEEYASAVRLAVERVCDRYERPWLCWRGRGWVSEYDGELSGAVPHYRRIADDREDPRPFAGFLARHGRCAELREFAQDWNAEKKSSDGHRSFRDYYQQCASAATGSERREDSGREGDAGLGETVGDGGG